MTFLSSKAFVWRIPLSSFWYRRRLFRLATGIGEGQQEPTMAASKLEEAKHEDGSTRLQKASEDNSSCSLLLLRLLSLCVRA